MKKNILGMLGGAIVIVSAAMMGNFYSAHSDSMVLGGQKGNIVTPTTRPANLAIDQFVNNPNELAIASCEPECKKKPPTLAFNGQ
jgi:hypothetical protein